MIRKRSILVALMMAAQALCLTVGLSLYHRRMTDSLLTSICKDTLSENQLLAKELAGLVGELHLKSLAYESADWQRLQNVIERIQLPNGGFACVLDRQGRVLCHPKLRKNPTLRTMPLGTKRMRQASGDAGWPISAHFDPAPANQNAFAGLVDLPDGTHLVGGMNLPTLNAQLLVHQRESALLDKVNRMLAPLWYVGMVTDLILCLIGGAATWLLVSHYESSLAGMNARLESLVRKRTSALVQTRDAVVFGLAKLAESRDPETGQHLERMSIYATLLAKKLRNLPQFADQIDDDFVRRIGLGSALHDIGKVGISDDILLKPGPLTKVERYEMQKHAEIGGNCLLAIEQRLGRSNFLSMATDIAFSHHEWWNGGGYPHAKRGEEIPLVGRIVALADVYDALTSKRVYKEAMSHQQAMAIIQKGTNTQFDPSVVQALLEIQDQFEEVCASHPEPEQAAPIAHEPSVADAETPADKTPTPQPVPVLV